MKSILVTGAKGFIAGYVIEELLNQGWQVIGVDNLSKYGDVEKSYDQNPNYIFVKRDATDVDLIYELIDRFKCEHFIAGAALIGGITYFHEYPYDIINENNAITGAAFDAAITAHRNGILKKITVLSSSMVFECATEFPTPEGHEKCCPPPLSTYGFQKLATEYYAKGASQQFGLPYTILRPFNAIGTGEYRSLRDANIASGNVTLAMSHVVPDLIQKILKGQNPLHILGEGNQLRHYTYAGDLAKGIVASLEHEKTVNEDYNISTAAPHTVKQIADIIHTKITGHKVEKFINDPPFIHDVQNRSPATYKAREHFGFDATTKFEDAIDPIIEWVKDAIENNLI